MTMLLLSFLGMLLMSFSVILLSFRRSSSSEKMVEKRLKQIRKTLSDDGPEDELRLATKDEELMSDRLGAQLDNFSFAQNLKTLILHSGSTATVGSIVLSGAGLALGCGVAARIFLGPWPLVIVAAGAGAMARYLWLRFQKSRRLKKFNTALPDALELMARALRAGHSLPAAIEIIAQQSPQPLGGEFEHCFQQQKFGIPFRDALLEMGERTPSKDLHFLVTAVLVQKETGGDLTDVLDRTTRVIRERVRIEGEVRTYTAQGRLTGWILACLPIIMLLLINIVTPGYSAILFHDPLGQKLLYAGGTLIVIGAFIISKIVDIKV